MWVASVVAAMDALLQQRAEVKAALSETRRKLREEAAKKRAADKREARAWNLTGSLGHIVLILYFLANRQAEPVLMFLRSESRKRHWPTRSDEDVMEQVSDMFLAISLEDLLALTDMDEPKDPPALLEASRRYEEWRLAMWVERLNARQGVAPSTSLVLERHAQSCAALPEAARPRARGVAAQGFARKWAFAWRKRHGARHGLIPAREDVPLEERRAKARDNMGTNSTIVVLFGERKLFPYFYCFRVPQPSPNNSER